MENNHLEESIENFMCGVDIATFASESYLRAKDTEIKKFAKGLSGAEISQVVVYCNNRRNKSGLYAIALASGGVLIGGILDIILGTEAPLLTSMVGFAGLMGGIKAFSRGRDYGSLGRFILHSKSKESI